MYQNITRGEIMFISDIMSSCIAECTEDEPVEAVYDRIQKCEHGFVVVIDSESHRVPLGVVSEHSICEQVVAKGRKLRGLTAASVLDSRIRKLPSSTPAADCVKYLADGPRRVPFVVVDDHGGLCGIVTRSAVERLVRPAELPSVGPAAETLAARNSDVPEIPAFGWVQ